MYLLWSWCSIFGVWSWALFLVFGLDCSFWPRVKSKMESCIEPVVSMYRVTSKMNDKTQKDQHKTRQDTRIQVKRRQYKKRQSKARPGQARQENHKVRQDCCKTITSEYKITRQSQSKIRSQGNTTKQKTIASINRKPTQHDIKSLHLPMCLRSLWQGTTSEDKTWQRQDKTRQDKQGKARQDKINHGYVSLSFSLSHHHDCPQWDWRWSWHVRP